MAFIPLPEGVEIKEDEGVFNLTQRLRASILKGLQHVATIGEGNAFGELALTSSNSERKATIVCDEGEGKRVCLAYLSRKDFDHAIKKAIKEKQK